MRDVGSSAFKWRVNTRACACQRRLSRLMRAAACIALLQAHAPPWRCAHCAAHSCQCRYLQVGGALLAVNYPQRLHKVGECAAHGVATSRCC